MKGVVATCLGEMIVKRFGKEKWQKTLEAAGLAKNALFLPGQNVEDAAVMKVFRTACAVTGISAGEGAEAFGEYWCCEFAPRIYSAYYTGAKNAKEFLLRMPAVHTKVTKDIPDAHPPVFTFEQPAPNKLIMKYSSRRGLGDIFAGLVRGVGKAFKEDLQIRRVNPNAVEITFAY